MNDDLDVIEAVKLVLSAVDRLAEHALRTSGSVEAQQASTLARRARLQLDALAGHALREVG